MEPRTGAVGLLRVPNADVQGTLTRLRESDPYYVKRICDYELIPWVPVIGKDELERL